MQINYCAKCKINIISPSLSEEQKNIVLTYIREDRRLFALGFLMSELSMDMTELKNYVDHICKDPGVCNSCDYDNLKKELEVCPVCESLNINWK